MRRYNRLWKWKCRLRILWRITNPLKMGDFHSVLTSLIKDLKRRDHEWDLIMKTALNLVRGLERSNSSWLRLIFLFYDVYTGSTKLDLLKFWVGFLFQNFHNLAPHLKFVFLVILSDTQEFAYVSNEWEC